MKTYLALISAAALALTACSQEEAKPAETAAPAASAASENAQEASAPATASEAETSPASEATSSEPTASAEAPANCEATVESDDAMKYNTSEITIDKACKEFKLTLKHVGKMPKTAMGHNLVIADAANVDGIDKDGAAAGPDADYLKAGDDRVIAHTKLIGGGEEDTITIDTSKFAAGNQYEFFCSFPGHIGQMRGTVNVVN